MKSITQYIKRLPILVLAFIMVLQSVAHSQMMLEHYQTQVKISKIYAELPEFARGSLDLILCGADRYTTDSDNIIIPKCDNCISASIFILTHYEFTGLTPREIVGELIHNFTSSEYYPPKWLRPLMLAPPAALSA